ncbi:MAG: glycosyltransferase family 39 protein [Ardenticatenia bacterium]|nr:MAG: glycosyltransferase family 39 protein [Ardenticatenia bacterium]
MKTRQQGEGKVHAMQQVKAHTELKRGWRYEGLVSIPWAHLALIAIMGAALFLHLANLQAIGDANRYYTAAVKSMLQSWHNFFFVAAEPGASVTVDKPPLGLWIEAAFAWVLGVHGWVVVLPNILAGVLSVPLLYALVKRSFGKGAGLVAALTLTLTPIFVATNRNNTMDGMLTFTLLLAAWAFLKATESGRLRWVVLGGVLVGLGFEIKMLQAFLPLPAFYALYALGSREAWRTKIKHLGIATIVIMLIGLAWPLAVDMTPPENRPYVGSSTNNTVMELIIGHNGLARLLNPRQVSTGDAANSAPPAGALPRAPRPGAPPDARVNDGAPPGGQPDGQPGGTPFANETGSPGIERFFVQPLAKQMSWLLPFALLGVVLLGASRWHVPLQATHRALVLWGGWLLTCWVFFSRIEGIFHAYYTIMLTPPLAALVGATFAWFWRRLRHVGARVGLLLAGSGVVAFHLFIARQEGMQAGWLYVPVLLLLVAAGLGWWRQGRASAMLTLLAMLWVPAVWTGLTTFDPTPNTALPTAYSPIDEMRPGGDPTQEGEVGILLDFLQANPPGTSYLIAVSDAQIGAPLVLSTGQPVLYMGGFNGGDSVVDAEDIAQMVARGDLRYVVVSGRTRADIATWLDTTCRPVEEGIASAGPRPPGRMQLYDCMPE